MRHPFPTFAVLCGLLAPLGLQAPSALAETVVGTTATPAASARVIVKFKADATLLRKQALSASAEAGGALTAAQAATLHAARAEALGSRVGLALAAGHGVAERTQVVTASGLTSAELASKLAADGDVEYAVIDGRRKAFAAPNDPLYASGPALGSTAGGPVVGQWYLRAPDATVKSSLDIEGAWAVTTGSASIVVAVLDTGLRFDHADLQGGNVLPGYDMVSTAFVGNDGDGRDADATDPGDFVTAADVRSSGNTIGCTTNDVQNSSWHGTQTLGLIGAATGNGVGMAGVGHGSVRVMPVRVLGKCGGFDSDIIAGMRWAAGLAVTGVPTNTTPAKVINLSLGGTGACSSAYTQAIAEINAAGTVVVASAGNSEGHAVSTPANCSGVIAVAGLRHVGTKVGFSDLGPEITLSAPGGNCINVTTGSPCLYPILTSSNPGTTTPVAHTAGGSIYTDSFDTSLGTSFSAPLVSGTVALMFSANPALTPAQVKSTLQSTARAFPTTGGDNGDGSVVTTCVAPQANVAQDQCYCTTSTCGAGMLDAGAALRALVVAGTTRITLAGSAVAGTALTLNGATSTAATGRTVAGYQWRLVDGGGIVSGFTGATNAATATLVPSAAGSIVVSLAVTDSGGTVVSATQTIAVNASTLPPPTAAVTFTPAAPVAGGAIQLSAASSAAASPLTLTTYQWAVTQGGSVATLSGSATGPTAALITTASGVVTVSLTVTDSAGRSATSSASISVSAAPPSANIQLIAGSLVAGSQVKLDGSGSSAGAGRTIKSYQWVISSGAATTNFVGASNASSATVLPSAAGSFSVTLTVTDDGGLATSSTQVISVTASSTQLPSAIIGFTPAAPIAGDTVQLNAAASSAVAPSSIRSYQWAVVQGAAVATISGSTTNALASLVTRTGGDVVVSLTVTDSAGATTASTSTIRVNTVPPVAAIRLSSGSLVAGTTLTYDGASSTASTGRTIKAYQWSISSGAATAAIVGSATSSSVSVLPSAAGSFTLTLAVTDDIGTTASATQVADVAAAPVAASGSSGGGALDLTWMAWLALAVLAAARTTRHPGQAACD